jgi:hypothetical protein
MCYDHSEQNEHDPPCVSTGAWWRWDVYLRVAVLSGGG